MITRRGFTRPIIRHDLGIQERSRTHVETCPTLERGSERVSAPRRRSGAEPRRSRPRSRPGRSAPRSRRPSRDAWAKIIATTSPCRLTIGPPELPDSTSPLRAPLPSVSELDLGFDPASRVPTFAARPIRTGVTRYGPVLGEPEKRRRLAAFRLGLPERLSREPGDAQDCDVVPHPRRRRGAAAPLARLVDHRPVDAGDDVGVGCDEPWPDDPPRALDPEPARVASDADDGRTRHPNGARTDDRGIRRRDSRGARRWRRTGRSARRPASPAPAGAPPSGPDDARLLHEPPQLGRPAGR